VIVSTLECDRRPGPVLRRIDERAVPLGGPRGLVVTRTLPQKTLPTVGAWCFLDQGGPERHVSKLLPHPHIGLQTVSWLVEGEIIHRDTVGSEATIRPGQLNVMTSGRGIAHSEFTPGDEALDLHLLQLWIALPDAHRWQAPHFEQHSDLPRVADDGFSAAVLFGSLLGASSPAAAYSPLLGVELRIEPHAAVRIPLRRDFEHALLAARGAVRVGAEMLGHGPLLYLGTDREAIELAAGPDGAIVLLIGGEPLEEQLVMWWNFVGRSHEEIAEAREDWASHAERFGPEIPEHAGARIPAPPLPSVRLTPRARATEPSAP